MRKNLSVTALNEFYPSASQVTALSARDKFKYTVAHYEVAVSNFITSAHYTDNEDSSIIANLDGWAMPIGGPDFDRKVEAAVLTANKNFLVDEGVANAQAVKNAVYQIMMNSRVMYSILNAVHRTQNGMYIQDEDKVQLSPIFWHHEHKALTGLDWNINGGSFLESHPQANYSTLAQRRGSNDVCFTFAMTNNQWDELVRDIVGNMHLTPGTRSFCEHMFGKVFYVPSRPEDAVNFVVFWPTSQILLGVDKDDEDVEESMHGYDYDNAVDNIATYNNLRTLVDAFVLNTIALFDKYPQLDEVFNVLGATSGTTKDFIRLKSSNKIDVVYDQDVEHFIKETSIGFRYTSESNATIERHTVWGYSTTPGVRGSDRRFAFRPTDLKLASIPQEHNGISTFVNISYADQTLITSGYAELCKGWVSPLSAAIAVQWQGASATNSSKIFYFIPLMWIGGDVWDVYDALENSGSGSNEYPSIQDSINNIFSWAPTLVASGAICPAVRLILKDNWIGSAGDFADHLLMMYEELLEHTLDTYVITTADAQMLQLQAADLMVGAAEGYISLDYHTGEVDKSGDNVMITGSEGSKKSRRRNPKRRKASVK